MGHGAVAEFRFQAGAGACVEAQRRGGLGRSGEEVVADLVEELVQPLQIGGQLGRPSGARFRTYERLKRYAEQIKGMLFDTPQLAKTIEEIYRFPLRQSATESRLRRRGLPSTGERKAPDWPSPAP